MGYPSECVYGYLEPIYKVKERFSEKGALGSQIVLLVGIPEMVSDSLWNLESEPGNRLGPMGPTSLKPLKKRPHRGPFSIFRLHPKQKGDKTYT